MEHYQEAVQVLATRHHFGGVSHAAKIGANVDDVRHNQEETRSPPDPPRVCSPNGNDPEFESGVWFLRCFAKAPAFSMLTTCEPIRLDLRASARGRV